MTKRTLIRILLLSLLAPLTLQATSATALAANDLKVCSRDDGEGKCYYRKSYDSSFKNDACDWPSCVDNPYHSSFNDTISSLSNRTAYWWRLYEDTGYKGFTLCIKPHGYDSDLGNNTSMEDKISSVKNTWSASTPSGCDQKIG